MDWSDKAKRKAAGYWAFKLSRDNGSLSKSQANDKSRLLLANVGLYIR